MFSANSAAEPLTINQVSVENLNKNHDSAMKPHFNQSMAMPSAVTQETSKFNIVVSPTKMAPKVSQGQILEERSNPSVGSQ